MTNESTTTITYDATQDLAEVRALTTQMRNAEQQIKELGKQRRVRLARLRQNNVPFRVIASETGTTEHAIYKDLRWGKK